VTSIKRFLFCSGRIDVGVRREIWRTFLIGGEQIVILVYRIRNSDGSRLQ